MAAPRDVRRAVAVCGLLAVVACSGPAADSGPEAPSPRPAPPASTSSSAGGESPDRPRRLPRPVTIAFAGDVHFEGVLRARLDDPASALAPVSDALAAADLAIVNLETSIGVGGTPAPDKRYTFRAPPTAFAALAAAGVDVASLANNHALDYGRDSLPETFSAVRQARRLAVVGLGVDAAAAFRPATSRVGDTTVATLAASLAARDPTADPTGAWAATDSLPGVADAVDPARLLAAVKDTDGSADVVVVYLHWGIQGQSCPAPWQRPLAERLVGAGADVVVGSHAHRLQGDGRVGQGYVAYGLGNYAWYTADSPQSATTGVLTLTVQPPRERDRHAEVVRSRWAPARIGDDGLPRPLGGAEAAAFDRELTMLRECAGVSP